MKSLGRRSRSSDSPTAEFRVSCYHIIAFNPDDSKAAGTLNQRIMSRRIFVQLRTFQLQVSTSRKSDGFSITSTTVKKPIKKGPSVYLRICPKWCATEVLSISIYTEWSFLDLLVLLHLFDVPFHHSLIISFPYQSFLRP